MTTTNGHSVIIDPEQDYGEEYYRCHLGLPYSRESVHFTTFFNSIADELIRSLQPRTVLDAGCAMGLLVEAFWDRGVACRGIDISPYAIANVRRDMVPYCKVGSLAEPIEGTYDLITCIEVLEHIPEEDALKAITNMAKATNTILFSSSFTDLTEPTHVNVRQPIWWLERFSNEGFAPDLTYDACFVSQQAMLLRRRAEPLPWDVLRLFAELLRYKYAIVARDNQITAQALQVQQTSNRLEEVENLMAAANNPSAIRLEKPEQVDNEAVNDNILERLSTSESRIEQLEHELRSGTTTESLRGEMSGMRTQINWLIQEHERSAALNERYPKELTQNAQMWRTELSPMREASLRHSARLEQVESRLEQVEKNIATQSATLSQQITQVAVQTRGILESRIWQTLVSASRMVTKFSGR